jgi:hypothetical protein
MLPPPTLEEGKLEEGFFAHFSLGQIIVIPEALSHEGFFPVSAHCDAQFGGRSCIRYRWVTPFISYSESMIATSLDFRVSGVVVEIDAIS